MSYDCRELTSNYVLYSNRTAGKWPEKAVPRSDLNHWLKSRPGAVCLIAPTARRWELAPIAKAAGVPIEALTKGYLAVKLPAGEGS